MGPVTNTKDKCPAAEKDCVSPRASAERDLLVHVKDAQDAFASCGKVWMHACNEMNELSAKNLGEILSMFASKHKNTETLDDWLDTFVSTDPHVFKMNTKAFHCVHRVVDQDKLGFAEQTVHSLAVNDFLHKLFHNANCEYLKDISGLIMLAVNVCMHIHNTPVDSLHAIMMSARNKLVGWNRGLHLPEAVRWTSGKKWAYSIYLMGIAILFGHFGIPVMGSWLRRLFKHVKANLTLCYDNPCKEVNCLFFLVFGSIMNTQVSAVSQ